MIAGLSFDEFVTAQPQLVLKYFGKLTPGSLPGQCVPPDNFFSVCTILFVPSFKIHSHSLLALLILSELSYIHIVCKGGWSFILYEGHIRDQ